MSPARATLLQSPGREPWGIIECALLENQHFNFFSIAIDNANHPFEDQEFYLPLYVSVHRKDSTLDLGQAFTTLLDNMAKWLQVSTN